MSEICMLCVMDRLTSDERVGSCLKRTKSITDNENGHAEASKRLGLDTWDSNQCTDGV